jgi:hypothetical protein
VLLDEVEIAIETRGELLGGGEVRIGGGQLRQFTLPALQGGEQEVGFGREVVVEEAFGDAGGGGDLLDRDLVIGAAAEQRRAAREQLLATLLGAQPPPALQLRHRRAA